MDDGTAQKARRQRTLSIRFGLALIADLRREAERTDRPLSWVVRKACEFGLETYRFKISTSTTPPREEPGAT
jgi:hypothetical protein